jgi:hypothetical protein
VPKPRELKVVCKAAKAAKAKTSTVKIPSAAKMSVPGRSSVERQAGAAPLPAVIGCAPDPSPKLAPGVTLLAPNVLSVRHWDRLLGGRLLAPPARVDWARLLQRTFHVDVLACAQCGGRLRVLGEVTEPAMVRLILESLAMPTDAPSAARARDPTELLGQADIE